MALVVGYAVGSGVWVSASPGWYAEPGRADWQPPDLVFGLIWPYNFVAWGWWASLSRGGAHRG